MPMEYPVDLSPMPEDLVELVFDNGRIVMQSQSSRTKNSQNFKPQDKYVGKTNTSRIGSFGSLESFLNDANPGVASGEADLSLVDDMGPWFDDFLPETSGVTMSELPIHNSLAPLNKRSCVQTFESLGSASFFNSQKLVHSNGLDSHSSRTDPMSSWSTPQGQTSVSSFVSGVSDILSCTSSSIKDVVQPSASGTTGSRMQTKDSTLPGSSSSLPNFPFLSRHTALGRASIQNNSGLPSSCSSVRETMANKEKTSIATGSNLFGSAFLNSGSSQKENDFQNQISSGGSTVVPLASGSEPSKLPFSANMTNQSVQEDQGKLVSTGHPVIGANPRKGVSNGEATAEPVIASSSVCSGSSADRASDCQIQTLKRKDHDSEETEHQSEDVEEESVGVKKAGPARGATGAKRHRAAEVHNLSERRRRERINEKMRALQELIPNCNKVDKASMLDEAIEYLKTLQVQVQMMSMGAGVYMPQMMFPVGMQHMPAAHAPHFAPMGVGMGMGMGMGMGYGMQMLDMNGGSPMFPAPPIQISHFPSASVPGQSKFPGVAGPNLPNLWHPGQGHPISVPQGPLEPPTGHASTSSSMAVSVSKAGSQVEVPNTSPTVNVKDPVQSNDPRPLQDADVNSSIYPATPQVLPNHRA